MSYFNIPKVFTILFVLSLFLTPVFASPISPSSVLASDVSSKITYILEIRENGDAVWITEEMIILNTADDLLAWENYTRSFEHDKDRYLKEYQSRINNIISKYGDEIKRDMYADGFEIGAYTNRTIMGTYGVTKYRFVWHGFGTVKKGKISGGDVFSGVFLSKNDVLIISLPENYEPAEIIPKPDEIRDNDIIWYGYRNFYENEPSFEIEMKKNLFGVIASFFIVAIFSGYLILRIKKEKATELETDVIETKHKDEVIDTKSDKDTIRDILKKMGGEAYQSDLVNRTGFSKSKVSNLIKEMYEEESIIKIKRGNKNLIRLKK